MRPHRGVPHGGVIHRTMIHRRHPPARRQPFAHESDLVVLRRVDPLGDLGQILVRAAPLDQRGHRGRLSMMRDHVAHEGDVGLGEARSGNRGRLLGRQQRGSVPGAPGWTIGASCAAA